MFFHLLLALSTIHTVHPAPAWYTRERQDILERERGETVGGNITLTPSEREVNQIIMAAKHAEIYSAIHNGTDFLPALHFFRSRPLMAQSRVFQILKSMPKGGALHLHLGSITSVSWLIQNVTYRPHCFMCLSPDGILTRTGFFLAPPSDTDCKWYEISKERRKHNDPKVFDNGLYDQLVLTVNDPETVYPTINVVWNRLEHYFSVLGMLDYAPVLKDLLYQTFLEFHQDGVQYLEIRTRNEPYELDGSVHSQNWLLQTFSDVITEFRRDHPDFIGAKFIYAGMKRGGRSLALQDVKNSLHDLIKFPDVFAGYDLVQQEDVTPSLLYFLSELLYPQSHAYRLPYFFHAGETEWLDIKDNNLLDAVLLNTTRIGHGFALPKHPEVMKIVKEREIAIEVNPISNQVLKLVADLRNHPASILISQNVPVCISSDDPAVWEALPLSHDFYVAFTALAGADDGLAFLKQMALNSIKYSAMTNSEKRTAVQKWQARWDDFISEVRSIYSATPGFG